MYASEVARSMWCAVRVWRVGAPTGTMDADLRRRAPPQKSATIVYSDRSWQVAMHETQHGVNAPEGTLGKAASGMIDSGGWERQV